MTGGGYVPPSDSSHTLASYMNKPEREERGEQEGTAGREGEDVRNT